MNDINYKLCFMGVLFLFMGVIFSTAQVTTHLSLSGVLLEHSAQIISVFRFAVLPLGILIIVLGVFYERVGEKISLIAAIGILWITAATLLISTFIENSGHVIYALDDAYIHMAIAKNVAQHGVWGITQYEFTSTTSSLLYTLLLSATYYLFGVNELIPLILNTVFATLLICFVDAILRQKGLSRSLIFIVLVSLIFFTPLLPLLFSGMEHTLQILIVIPFVCLAAKLLSMDKPSFWDEASLLCLGVLVAMVRYEGMFLIFIVSTLFCIRKRWGFAFILCASALLPIAIYGIIAMSKGWFFLPNSLLLKSNTPELSALGVIHFLCNFAQIMLSAEHVSVLVITALILFVLQYDKQRHWRDSSLMLIIFVFATILHIMFARVGWFYRYEAYLMALGIFVIAISLNDYLSKKTISYVNPKYIASIYLILLATKLFVTIGGKSLEDTFLAPHERYLEHILPAQFIKEYYQDKTIVVNDIGAICFFSDVKILDMYGLGSIEPLNFRKKGYDKKDVQAWAEKEGAVLAYVQIQWAEVFPRIPDQWIKVGQWEIPENVVFGDTLFAWYAIDPKQESTMIKHLREFSKKLPKDIKQSGKYTKALS